MINVLKFMERMWFMLCIVTFIIAVYWTINNQVYDALYFYAFSVVAILLFMVRRRQRRAHENKNSKDK